MSKNTSWGGVAEWYDDVVRGDDSYQARVILPNLLRILGPKKGVRLLDLGCGQGFFSHACAEAGADTVGVDISPELVELGKKGAAKSEAFFAAPAESLPSEIEPSSFDAAFSVLAIQNMEKLGAVLEGVSRALKPGGKFVMVLNHPAFRIPKKSSWGFDEKADIQYRRVDAYLSESSAEIDMHPGTGSGEKTHSFHRPLQTYSKSLFNNGFAIARIEEWTSHKKSEPGPRRAAEDRSRREMPLFMCIEAFKL